MARRDKNSQRDPHGLAPWVKEVVRLFGDGSVVAQSSFTIQASWMGSGFHLVFVLAFQPPSPSTQGGWGRPMTRRPCGASWNAGRSCPSSRRRGRRGTMEVLRRATAAMKTHTHEQAARQGRGGHWTAGDLEAARRIANELVYPDGPRGPTRHGRFRSAPCVTLEARAAFGYSVASRQTAEREKLGHPSNTDLSHMAQAQIDRVAIGCALVEHGHLTITGRSITPPIKTLIPLGIS